MGKETPPISRHLKIWNSIKRKTIRLRSLSKEKTQKKLVRADTVDDDVMPVHDLSNSPRGSSLNLDDVFVASEHRDREMPYTPPAFFHSRSEEKESEADSGIAVADNSVSFIMILILIIILMNNLYHALYQEICNKF